MSYADATATIDRIEAGFKELAGDVNHTSASTRNGWVFFLALHAYFFVALAGITHRDLLLETPVSLPLLQVQIGLKGFFIFGPVILVLVHMGILLQHVMLARQVREFHERVSRFEGANQFRTHRVRIQLNSYFFTHLIAGPQRSPSFAFFLTLLTWLSLGILPVLLLLDFQTTFLPYHDLHTTWAHRIYLILDLMMLAIFPMFMRYPTSGFVAGFGRMMIDRPFGFLLSLFLGTSAMFFSLSVATLPDEVMDRAMTTVLPVNIPGSEAERGLPPRQAFWLTSLLFDAGVDTLSGRPASVFGRNLVVADNNVVKESSFNAGETSISLRLRDLRYGVFDRSDLRQADLTGANLTRASLRETILLNDTKAEKAIFRGADLTRAQFNSENDSRRVGANLRGADFRNAVLFESRLSMADMRGALLQGTDMRNALAPRVNFLGAEMKGAMVQGALLQYADMDPDDLEDAKRQGGRF